MTDSDRINKLGGTKVVAKLCDLTAGAVSQWRKFGIPKPWVKFLSAIHPELFRV